MTYIDEHLGELIARYAAEDGCEPDEWTARAVRSVVAMRYQNPVTAQQQAQAGFDTIRQPGSGTRLLATYLRISGLVHRHYAATAWAEHQHPGGEVPHHHDPGAA